MGEAFDPNAGTPTAEGTEEGIALQAGRKRGSEGIDPTPFHSQISQLNQGPLFNPPPHSPYESRAFDLSAMNEAMPQRPQYGPSDVNVFSPASVFQMSQVAQYPAPRGQLSTPTALPGPRHPYAPPQYAQASSSVFVPPSPRNLAFPPQFPYPRLDAVGYGMAPPSISPVDPRFGAPAYGVSPVANDPAALNRMPPEQAPIPAYPRGPPRKPKQSGHALWVGNLPPAATITDLKDHFSRDATRDIESVFLISKSNCAFVNYRTEAACVAAMNRFHDSRFHGVRLVCRLRRGSSASTASTTVDENPSASGEDTTDAGAGVAASDEVKGPVIVGQAKLEEASTTTQTSDTRAPDNMTRVREKYFIVKSLTVQDLQASVRNGTWATQSHNEDALNRAFSEAENVYLIFSANKSGEYFGYARMASAISPEPVRIGSTPQSEEAKSSGAPQSITTAPTETAPRGRIIDDSARGTIFWESVLEDDPDSAGATEDSVSGEQWGRQFRIEWLSATRLPFFRTRGLRNPWNANREVKIARDGTELEPSVGRRLVAMFHYPATPAAVHGVATAGGMLPSGLPARAAVLYHMANMSPRSLQWGGWGQVSA